MSQLLKKRNKNNQEIIFGEFSLKLGTCPFHSPTTLLQLNIFHDGLNSEFDSFVFFHCRGKDNWIMHTDRSLFVSNKDTDKSLFREVYPLVKDEIIFLDDFVNLVFENHFFNKEISIEPKKENLFESFQGSYKMLASLLMGKKNS